MHVIVALTGASGMPYALRLLHRLVGAQTDISLVLSEAACVTLAAETDVKVNAATPDLAKIVPAAKPGQVRPFNPKHIGAPIASGSNRHDGMVVIPCSMGSLARIANGVADDLIARAADVTLKERGKLLLVTREMPLSLIHLRNMQAVTEAGATVMHACPHFYHRPTTVEELVDSVVDRVLDHLNIEAGSKRWRSDHLPRGEDNP